MQTDNQVKPDARTECDSTGSSPARCSAAFPIMEGGARRAKDDLTSIPWAMIAPHEATARQNHGGQTLARLAQRGGLCPLEAVAVLEDADYRKRWPQMMHTRDEQEKLTLEARAILKQMVANWTPPNDPSSGTPDVRREPR